MTVLISLHDLTKSYGTQHLFEKLSFGIIQRDRVGLIGPNGSGKSTLLKIIHGNETSDNGYVAKRQGIRIGYAGQAPEFSNISLEQVLIQNRSGDPLELVTQARILLGKVGLHDPTQQANTLSGGWKKRLDIARALMGAPDLMLLDEPTNHLDLEGIIWLENFLKRERFSFIVISHDRTFLENVSNKIIELNRAFPQGVLITQGPLSNHLQAKQNLLTSQSQQERALANIVKEEIDWLRRSPKARTTKSQARVQRANELIEQLSEIKQRTRKDKVEIDFTASERETRKLMVAKNLSKSVGGKLLFKGLDLTLTPGSCLGIVGANGTGKTTLLKVLAGQITPDLGTVKTAEDLKLVYFDQHREKIPPETSLRRALDPISDTVNYRGQLIHVNGWAKRFLFSPDRLELPISCLSGGERARILIARLMLEPADILFLDEPTNDLDIPTLEVIEESLKDFMGAVVVISHDRCLMDRICTQFVGLGIGKEGEIFADYSQWENTLFQTKPPSEVKEKIAIKTPKTSKKLSYKEQKELEGMESAILRAEEELNQLNQIQEVGSDPQKAMEHYRLLSEAQSKLEQLYARWQELDSKNILE